MKDINKIRDDNFIAIQTTLNKLKENNIGVDNISIDKRPNKNNYILGFWKNKKLYECSMDLKENEIKIYLNAMYNTLKLKENF